MLGKGNTSGEMNLEVFYGIVEHEILRLQRVYSPFSIATIKINSLVQVNENSDQGSSNDALKTIAMALNKTLRKTDLITRLGVDRLVIFMPVTDKDSVKSVMENIRYCLLNLAENNYWIPAICIGVVTCNDGSITLDELISKSDCLLLDNNCGEYEVNYAVSLL